MTFFLTTKQKCLTPVALSDSNVVGKVQFHNIRFFILSNEKADGLTLVAANSHKHKQLLCRRQEENPNSIQRKVRRSIM